MKKLIALIAAVMALVIGFSVIAIAEQTANEETTAAPAAVEAPAEAVVEETEAVAEETETVEAAAEVTEEAAEEATEETTEEAVVVPVATEPPHVHTWSADGRVCTGCGEAYPCWNDAEKTFNHDFTDSDVCLVCGTALYCGIEGHEMNEEHALGACGVPGHFVCDGLDHDRVYGKGFDYEGHTACLEEVEHFCEECGRSYTCEFSNSHVRCIKCGEMWCYKAEGDHTEAACGHRHCEIRGNYAKHAKCEGCGKFMCKGGNHENCVPVVPPTTDDPAVPPTTDDPVVPPTSDVPEVPPASDEPQA